MREENIFCYCFGKEEMMVLRSLEGGKLIMLFFWCNGGVLNVLFIIFKILGVGGLDLV